MSVAVSRLPARMRMASEGDIDAILKIERSVYDFPWTHGVFRDCMKAGHICVVQENGNEIFGYGIMSHAVGECHILNLCVDSIYQSSGYGRSLLKYLLEIAGHRSSRVVFLEVRISNTRAFKLYHELGFNEVATRKNYYPAAAGKREHALVLAKVLR